MVGLVGRVNAREIGELMYSGDTIRIVGGAAAVSQLAMIALMRFVRGTDIERAYTSGLTFTKPPLCRICQLWDNTPLIGKQNTFRGTPVNFLMS